MAYVKVVEMLGENLASFLELAKKLLIDWGVDPKRLLHMLQNLRKADLIGLLDGTHEIKSKCSYQEFIIWKTIKIGNLKSVDGLSNFLIKNGRYIDDWACEIIKHPQFTLSTVLSEIQLFNISVSDLGFNKGADYKDICDKAKELGLKLCPNEVGPQLCLQYEDQLKGEFLGIAMESVALSNGNLRIFGVSRKSSLPSLHGYDGRPDSFSDPHDRFVFCK